MQPRTMALALGALLLALVLAFALGRMKPPSIQSTGTASIGGPFTLTDQAGRVVTDKDFRGRFLLIYFGYTYCPDVCPGELQTLATALDALGPKAERVQPLFITVDPVRDTPAVLAAYVKHFHPRLVGLTGTPAEIEAVKSTYRAYSRVADDATDASSYTVDHTSITYLMGPDGKFIEAFGYNTASEAMAKAIATHL